MSVDSLTAGLQSPSIAWNTQKRHIVEQMTEGECTAIARRTTYNLRDRSPEIRRYLDNALNTRRKYAKLLFNQELLKSAVLSDTEVTMHKRMAKIAEAQIKHQKETVDFLRHETGYRICCLIRLAGDDILEQSNQLLKDMEMLSVQQDTLNQALLLDDLIGILVKQASKYPEYDAQQNLRKYESVLVDFTTTIRTTLESCRLPDSDSSVAEYLDARHAEQPSLHDSVHAAMLSFALTKSCFEKLNQAIASRLSEAIKSTLQNSPELMLQTT